MTAQSDAASFERGGTSAAVAGGTGPQPDHGGAPIGELTDVLVRSLRALGDAGRPVQASRLAARAWWLLRDEHARHAERVNGTMHYLARLPEEPDATGAPGTKTPGSSEERKDLP